ncbi:hypothetical protein B0T21DRAFT_157427 [Apiosordaria backusii]|uniref:Xylanolytic transcriptional activator regulatory domain-containing protein n=1 Tax=Apiosordaria backusii TaxID=314023 RepID=A0AA40BMU1_9PEZI|nr:hypothetical protein B0T21DRAFT_157427 [Apiosordaria backusii]
MRPPMCLQYAIWTMAANNHPKYGCYHEALYRRARQYLESDELKGHGEHFISVAHAQAWALIAADEARRMLFTRAALSSARCVRIVGMMGLHRLDSTVGDDEHPIAPMIPPPKGWVELEERRRLFWGAFCIDSYAGISTGWPTLIDTNQVTTHLPASEDAFAKGQEEKSTSLQSPFNGFDYSTYGGNVVICHIFNQIMKHAHCPMPTDRPDDLESGPFWQRHRELDNLLSTAFMFLHDRLRLPRNISDPVAVQTNMNLHAAIICLHNTSYEKADKLKLPLPVKQDSRTRALMAAGEIVNILKLTHNMKTGYKSPLMALSLYCAASTYISVAKDHQQSSSPSSPSSSASFMTSVNTNLETLLKSMESISKLHYITRAYLNQILLDISRSGISLSFTSSSLLNHPENLQCGHGIPIVARTSTSKHTRLPVPFPGPGSGPIQQQHQRMIVPGVFSGVNNGMGAAFSGIVAGSAMHMLTMSEQQRQFVHAFHPCDNPSAAGTQGSMDARAVDGRVEKIMMFGFRGSGAGPGSGSESGRQQQQQQQQPQQQDSVPPQELPFRLGMHGGVMGTDFGDKERDGDVLLHFSPGNVGGSGTSAGGSQGQGQGQSQSQSRGAGNDDDEKMGEQQAVTRDENAMEIYPELQDLGMEGGVTDWGMMDPTDTFYSLMYNDGSNNNNNNGGVDNSSGNMWSMNDFTGMWDGSR